MIQCMKWMRLKITRLLLNCYFLILFFNFNVLKVNFLLKYSTYFPWPKFNKPGFVSAASFTTPSRFTSLSIFLYFFSYYRQLILIVYEGLFGRSVLTTKCPYSFQPANNKLVPSKKYLITKLCSYKRSPKIKVKAIGSKTSTCNIATNWIDWISLEGD